MMHEQSSATVVLGVETSGATGGIALLQDHKLIDTISFSLGGQLHSQLLLPAIKEILTKSNLHLKDLSCIAVSQGPGSFTGLRIGLSVSNAIGWFLKIPIVGIDTMESFASLAMETVSLEKSQLICTLSDAKQEKFYYSLFKVVMNGNVKTLERVEQNQAGTLSDIERIIKQPTHFCGDKILYNKTEQFTQVFKDNLILCPYMELPSAVAIARVASAKFSSHYFDSNVSEPNYVRVGYHSKTVK